MLHDINFMDWQEHQRLQRKQKVRCFCFLVLMVFLWAESGFFWHWHYTIQSLALAERDYQRSNSLVHGLKQQAKKGEQTDTKLTELNRITAEWLGKRTLMYAFIHALKVSGNASVSVNRLTQNAMDIELDGSFLSQKPFHTFLNTMSQQPVIHDVRVIAVSAVPGKTESSLAYSQFRIHIRLNSPFPPENRGPNQ